MKLNSSNIFLKLAKIDAWTYLFLTFSIHSNLSILYYVLSQGSCLNAEERSIKKFRRHKIGAINNETEEKNISNGETDSQIENDIKCNPPKDANVEDRLVTWMSMDETQFLLTDKLKDDDLAADCDDTDDSGEEDDCEEVDTHIDQKKWSHLWDF